MLMNKIFTKTQYNYINKFIDDELELINELIILNKKSEKNTKKNILDYSKSLFINQKKKSFYFKLNFSNYCIINFNEKKRKD